jgi:hypothetical protein
MENVRTGNGTEIGDLWCKQKQKRQCLCFAEYMYRPFLSQKISSEFWIVNEWPISLSNTEAQSGLIRQHYVYNFSLHLQFLARGHDRRQQASRQVGYCDINLLAAEFSSCESLEIIVWAYGIVIFMLDCWSIILLWTCCIYVYLWFWCFRIGILWDMGTPGSPPTRLTAVPDKWVRPTRKLADL